MKKIFFLAISIIFAIILSMPFTAAKKTISANAASNNAYNTLYGSYDWWSLTLPSTNTYGTQTSDKIYWNSTDLAVLYMHPSSHSGNNIIYSGTALNWEQVNIYADVIYVAQGNDFYFHKSLTLTKNGKSYYSKNWSSLTDRTSLLLFSENLQEGDYVFTYVGVYTETGGAIITFTYVFNFTIWQNPPSYELKAGGSTIANNSYTNQAITYSAASAKLNGIYVKQPNASSYTFYSNSTITIPATSVNGWYYFYADDVTGNITPTVSIYLDTMPPNGTLYADGVLVSNESITSSGFNYLASDSGSGIDYLVYKPPTSSSWITYTSGMVIPQTSTNGQYDFRAIDKCGNVSGVSTIYLYTSAPIGTLYGGTIVVSNGGVTNADYIKFVASDSQSGIKNIFVKLPNASNYINYINDSQLTEQGTYDFYCVNNAGVSSIIYSITLKKTVPSLSCTVGFSTIVSKSFTVTASDIGGSVNLYYKTPSQSNYSLASSISYTVLSTAINGKYYFYAEDNLGTRSEICWVELNMTAPEAQFVYSDTDNSVCITWSDISYTGKLNGNNYEKGTWITQEGNYRFIITNTAGLYSTYDFTIGHNYNTQIIAPTCSGNGYTRHICSYCGDYYDTDIVPALGHSFISTVIPVTCAENGGTRHKCSACGYEYMTDIIPSSGHIYDSHVTKEATCENSGERQHDCERCGDHYSEIIPASGHNYAITDVIKEGKITKRVWTCTVCGHTYIEDLGDQYEKVTSYVELLFNRYSPYMIWVFLGTASVWSIFMGIFYIIAQKNEEREKAKKMLINYAIGMIAIFIILVACPYLIRGIAALVT